MCCSQPYGNNWREKTWADSFWFSALILLKAYLEKEFRLIAWNEVLVCFTDKGLISTRILWKSPCWTRSVLQQRQDYHNEEKTPPIPKTKAKPNPGCKSFSSNFFSVKEKTCMKSKANALKIIFFLKFRKTTLWRASLLSFFQFVLSAEETFCVRWQKWMALECYPMQ